MCKYNVHGGHAGSGRKFCGAKDILDESKEDRLVANEIIRLLNLNGQVAYNCTVNSGSSATDVLRQICSKCRKHKVDLDISVHFNAGVNDKKGNGQTTGFEVWVTNDVGIKKEISARIRSNMKKLGFKDRGTKTTGSLYFLNHTTAPAILLEICFVDDKDDANLYKKIGYKKIAEEIVKGILDKDTINTSDKKKKPSSNKVKVNAKSGVNFRKSINGTIIDTILYGTYVEVLAKEAGIKGGYMWSKIKYNGNTGYVIKSALNFIS